MNILPHSLFERIFILFLLLLYYAYAIPSISTTINGEMNFITTENALTTENNDNDDDSDSDNGIAKLIGKLIVVNGTLCYNKDLLENATAATTNRSDDVTMELSELDCLFVNSSSSENDTDSEEGWPMQDDDDWRLKLLKKLPSLVKKMPSSLLKKLPSLAKSALKRLRRPKPTKAPKPVVTVANHWRPLPSPRPTVPTPRPYYYNYPNGHGGSRKNGRGRGGGYGGYNGNGHWSSRRSKNG